MKKPEALRLADALENWPDIRVDLKASAAELRRLQGENAKLRIALKEIEWSNSSEWQADRARAALGETDGSDRT